MNPHTNDFWYLCKKVATTKLNLNTCTVSVAVVSLKLKQYQSYNSYGSTLVTVMMHVI